MEANHSRSESLISGELDKDVLRSEIGGSNVWNSETRNSSFQSSMTDMQLWASDQANTSDAPVESASPTNQVNSQIG